MTDILPLLTPGQIGRYAFREFPDLVPFTIREAASWESILSSIRVWIRDDLVPYLEATNAGDVWQENADALTDAVNEALATATGDFASMFNEHFVGSIAAPVPTGVADTDTVALKAAITAAQTAGYDLRLTPSPLGVVKNYKLKESISWSMSRGSLIGTGHVGLDFSAVPTSYQGAALKIYGENGDFSQGAHLAASHRVEGFRMIGHNTDSSMLDAFLVADTAGNIDLGRVVAVQTFGFHDGITFGDNVWSIDFHKCAIGNSHRYGINLQMGVNAGECISLTGTSIYGGTNAAKTAAAIYAPANTNVEFRMFGGSLDYNDREGKIEGGNLSFHAVHIEDDRTGQMFTYTQSVGELSVSFRDCSWDSSATSARPAIHEILNTSGGTVTLNFDGDKGGVYPNTRSDWVVNSAPANDYIIVQHKAHTVTGIHMLGQPGNLAINGTMEPVDFVASSAQTTGWWAASTTGATWSFGPGGNPGAGLRLVGTQAANHYAQQNVRIPTGRPLWIGGKIFVNAYTSGGAEILYTFLDANQAALPGGGRIGTTVTAQSTDWSLRSRRIQPPPGAQFIQIRLSGGGFVGTATFDQVEVIPI